LGQLIDLKEAEEKAKEAVEDRVDDWYDLDSWEEPVIDSSDIIQLGDKTIYVLEGYIDVEFKTGVLSSEEGRILFTVKLDAETGKILSIKQEEEEPEEEEEE